MSVAMILKAAQFAALKHRDQRRKDANASPYINHPLALANVLAVEGGDPEDPLDVALTIEAALRPAPDPTPGELAAYLKPTVGATHRAILAEPAKPLREPLEKCREEKDAPGRPCNRPTSATGRCMDCGAFRWPPEGAEPAPAAPVALPYPVSVPPPNGPGLVYKVKAVTGWPDYQIADLLKLKRPTVQAYVSGRLPERLTADQAAALRAALERQASQMLALVEEIIRPQLAG